MGFNIEIDPNQLKALAKGELDKALTWATALTLTQAAFSSRAAVQAMLRQRLQIRKPFLPRSVVVNKATKQQLESEVLFLDRATLVHLLEEGGIRTPRSSRNIAIPGDVRNKRGNITAGKRPRAMLARPDTFVAEIKGTLGIWQRMKRGNTIKLLYNLKPTTKYRRGTINFYETVAEVAPKVIQRRLWRNLVAELDRRRLR